MAERLVPQHLDLPTPGAWVEFADPEDMDGEDHQRVVESMRGLNKVGQAMASGNATLEDALSDINMVAFAMDAVYGTACMLIEKWNIPYTSKRADYQPDNWPLPSQDFAALRRLKLRDYNAIINAVQDVSEMLFGSEPDLSQSAVPGSPTGPASG